MRPDPLAFPRLRSGRRSTACSLSGVEGLEDLAGKPSLELSTNIRQVPTDANISSTIPTAISLLRVSRPVSSDEFR
jgi:hypothetical protein